MFEEAFGLIFTSFVLGFTAAISPGALFALIVSESIQFGSKAGIKIALAPLITDTPIILLSLYVFSQLSDTGIMIGLISFAGGAYIIYLGFLNMRFKPEIKEVSLSNSSLKKGIITNLLAPSPYLFWMSIGAPLLSSSFELGISVGILFLAVFYLLLVGLKVIIAVSAAKMKKFVQGRMYLYVVKLLGTVLIGLGLFYIYYGSDKL